MRQKSPSILTILLGTCAVSLIWTLALADSPTPIPADAPESPAQTASAQMPDPVSPLMQEIKQTFASQQEKMVVLEAAFAAALSEAQALEIQRQMQDLAVQTELKIMNIQVRHLRQAGQEEKAAALEATLQKMTTPEPTPAPTGRPAPGSSPGRG